MKNPRQNLGFFVYICIMITELFGAYSMFIDEMIESEKKLDEKIDEVVREYHEVTPNLPRKQKKKRRKELNREYSFLVSARNFQKNMFGF